MSKPSRNERGQQAEQLALTYLSQQGLQHVTSNYRCKVGEIDLVMRHPQHGLIFVEVRYRAGQSHGGALASIDRHKQQRLIRAASHYLQSHGQNNTPCRFDVLAIEGGTPARIEWISNAIEAS